MSAKKIGDIQVEQDLDFQRSEWRAERIGWVVFALLLIAALLGLFGQSGPLNLTTAGQDGGPFSVQYERFGHLRAPTSFEAQVGPENIQSEEVRVVVEGALTQAYEIREVNPQPDSVELSPEQYTYVFKAQQADGPLNIHFSAEPQSAGMHDIRIGPEGGQMLDVNQFVYP